MYTVGEASVLAWRLFGALAVWLVASVLYNIFLNPCARYPGPRLCKITYLPFYYQYWRLNQTQWFVDMHERYGSTVRLGPWLVSVLKPDILSDFERWDRKAQITKSRFLEGSEVLFTSNTLTERNRKRHAKRRRILARGFNDSLLKAAEPRFVDKVRLLTDILGGKAPVTKDVTDPDGGFNVGRWMSYLTWDIMGDLSFSAEINLLRREENRSMVDHARRSTHFGALQGHSRFINWSFLAYFTFPEGLISRIKFLLFCRGMANARANRKYDGPPDFFERALQAEDPETGEKYTKSQLIMEALLLVLAGADTTSSQITGCLFYLAKNPGVTSLLAEELHDRFPSVEDVLPGSTLSSCTILQAVVLESMRMAPAGSQMRREIIDPTGVTLSDGKTHFAKGTDVVYPNFSALRDATNYPDPHTWNPFRWIVREDRSNEEDVARMKKAFGNFSFGTRRCLGMNLAYNEMYLTISRIVWLYEFECMDKLGEKPGKPNEYVVRHHIVLVPEGPNMRFRGRSNGSKESLEG